MDSYGTNADGSERTAEEFRAAVAEKVLGWEVRRLPGMLGGRYGERWQCREPGKKRLLDWRTLPRPDESADDDRLALPVVILWDYENVLQWERELVGIRAYGARDGDEHAYLPGDWSAAALAVVEERERRGPLVRIHIKATTTEAPGTEETPHVD